jgi:hypothetical protein
VQIIVATSAPQRYLVLNREDVIMGTAQAKKGARR